MNASSDIPVPQDNQKRRVMPQMSRRAMIIGGVLATASGIAYARQPEIAAPQVEPDDFDAWLPKRVGNYGVISTSGVVLPPPDALSDRLYDNLSTRVYALNESDEAPIMVLLAYNNAQDGVLQVHRPEVCYPVGGYDLSETVQVPLNINGKTVPSNFFTASSPRRQEQVLYFTRLGDAYPRSWAEQRIAVMRDNLKGDIPDGMLMRFSVLSKDPAVALQSLQKFAAQFVTSSDPQLQKLLLA